jgi:lincosamide nucleotidyltransferase A/C/D/E
MMWAEDVLGVLDALDGAGIRFWLDGGWGVDALLGEQTRDHSDLDGVVALDDSEAAISALSALGYTLDEDHRPTRFVLSASSNRKIDFHPVVFTENGDAVQKGAMPGGGDARYPAAGFAGHGSVAGRSVGCLTPALLVLHHTGYPPQDKDRHNVRLLCERFGIELPPAYR